MSEQEAIAKLSALTKGDPEVAHGDADDILIELLSENGFRSAAVAWLNACERVGFWYA